MTGSGAPLEIDLGVEFELSHQVGVPDVQPQRFAQPALDVR